MNDAFADPPVAVSLPVVMDAHAKAWALGAVVVELAAVKPRVALADAGDVSSTLLTPLLLI